MVVLIASEKQPSVIYVLNWIHYLLNKKLSWEKISTDAKDGYLRNKTL